MVALVHTMVETKDRVVAVADTLVVEKVEVTAAA
jgi:hypothetical protein